MPVCSGRNAYHVTSYYWVPHIYFDYGGRRGDPNPISAVKPAENLPLLKQRDAKRRHPNLCDAIKFAG